MDQKISQLIEKILKNIVIIGSFLVIFVPLVVIPYSYFPYIIQKTNILKLLIQIIFFSYLVLALWKTEYRPKKTFLFWSVLAFAAVMLITTFTSQSVYRSWWGNWERSFGTFNYLHYFAWFIALAGVFNKGKYWYRILNCSLIVSLFISVYSLAQRLGIGPTFQSGLERVNGTLGNASFLASYMLFHIFIALLFVVEKISWKTRIWYLLVFSLDFLIMQLTATRGAQFGFFAALLLFIVLVFTLKARDSKAIKVLVGLIVIFFILFGIAIVFKNTNFIKNNYWLTRLTSYSLQDNTIQTRLHSWRWGLKGFRDYFIFGVGPENYQIVFNKYFEPDFYKYSGNEIWFDRAHNTLVDMASTMGILGLLSYLLIIWMIFSSLRQLWRQERISKFSFIVFTLLFVAYFIQNLAVFDSLNNLIIFYLLLAYLNYLVFSSSAAPKSNPAGSVFSLSPTIGLPILALALVTLFFSVDLRQIRENIYVYRAYIAGRLGKYEESMKWYELTYNNGIYKIDPAILLSSSLGELIQGSGAQNIPLDRKIADVNTAIAWMNRAIALDSKNMFLYYLQAKNYGLATELTKNVKYLEKGLTMAEQAKELRPGEVRSYWILAQLYLYGSQPEEALKYLEQAQKLTDNLPETHYYLAVVYQSLNNMEKYYEEVDKMIDKGFEFFSADMVKKLIPYYDNLHDLKRLIYLYNSLTDMQPQESNYWQDYVNLLILGKQYDLGLETLKRAANAVPAFSSRAYVIYQQILQLKEKGATTSGNLSTTTPN